MTKLRVIFLLLPLALGGCVLPIPSRTDIAPPVSGIVTDGTSGQALHRVTVVHAFNEDILLEVQSDQDGRFDFKTLQQHHWGYLFGIALNYPLPYWEAFPGTTVSTDLRIEHPGYQPYKRRIEFHGPADSVNGQLPAEDVMHFQIQLVPAEGT